MNLHDPTVHHQVRIELAVVSRIPLNKFHPTDCATALTRISFSCIPKKNNMFVCTARKRDEHLGNCKTHMYTHTDLLYSME